MDISGLEATFYAAGGLVLPQLASMQLAGEAEQEWIFRCSLAAPPGRFGQRSMPLDHSLACATFRAENGVRLSFLVLMVPPSDRMDSMLIGTIHCGLGRKTTVFTGFTMGWLTTTPARMGFRAT